MMSRNFFIIFALRSVITVTSAYFLVQTGANAQRVQATPDIKTFFQTYVARTPFGADKSTRFLKVSLPSRNAVVVYLSGNTWCGSGGCTLFILRAEGWNFKILGKTTTVSLPITLLATSHHGAPDIQVQVEGGGVLRTHRAVLMFNGRNYPQSPSAGPAKAARAIAGQTIIRVGNADTALFD